MRLKKHRIRELTFTQLLQIGFSFTIIIVLILFGVMYYTYTSRLLKENIRTSLKDFAISAQYIIDGDKHEALTDSHSKVYIEMCSQLARYKEAVGVYDVYTLVRGDATHTKFVLAAYDAQKTFMKPYIYTDEMKQAFAGKIGITSAPYRDDFGTFYSGYAPLYDSKGQIVAVVAVDISNAKIMELKRDIVVKTLSLFFLCFVVGNLLVYFVAKSLGNSFTVIISDLKKIGGGDLSVRSQSKLPKITELKDLEFTINEMAGRISDLIQTIAISANELKEKTGHISELIGTTDTSSQIMASAVEQMSMSHKNASASFDESLNELLLYKEDSAASILEFRAILDSVQATKDNLAEILQYLRRTQPEFSESEEDAREVPQGAIQEFESFCQRLYQQYDLFVESINAQMFILDKISDKRDHLVSLNQKIASDFRYVDQGNQRVIEAMERQVSAIQGVVKDVDHLEHMALDLNMKLGQVKTTASEDTDAETDLPENF